MFLFVYGIGQLEKVCFSINGWTCLRGISDASDQANTMIFKFILCLALILIYLFRVLAPSLKMFYTLIEKVEIQAKEKIMSSVYLNT